MKIDRKRAMDTFAAYVEHYNAQDEKVRLKIEHTYRVAELCEVIAQSLKLSAEETDLAWFIGLLHDVGRFEQLRQYGTFIDAESVDHAKYGAAILFTEGRIRDYLEKDREDELIETAVACHNEYRIPENLDERTRQFCDIIRDADKIDILKVNVECPLEEIYNVSSKELRSCQVTQEVMDSFEQKHAVLRSLKRAAVDHVVGHISLVYELVYPVSVKLVREQGYLEQLMNFQSENPVTMQQFERIREKMGEYMERKRG